MKKIESNKEKDKLRKVETECSELKIAYKKSTEKEEKLQKEMQEMKKKKKIEEQLNHEKDKLNHYEKKYNQSLPAQIILNEKERKALEDYMVYANAFNAMPHTDAAKQKNY